LLPTPGDGTEKPGRRRTSAFRGRLRIGPRGHGARHSSVVGGIPRSLQANRDTARSDVPPIVSSLEPHRIGGGSSSARLATPFVGYLMLETPRASLTDGWPGWLPRVARGRRDGDPLVDASR
jgi:hypothetical protein